MDNIPGKLKIASNVLVLAVIIAGLATPWYYEDFTDETGTCSYTMYFSWRSSYCSKDGPAICVCWDNWRDLDGYSSAASTFDAAATFMCFALVVMLLKIALLIWLMMNKSSLPHQLRIEVIASGIVFLFIFIAVLVFAACIANGFSGSGSQNFTTSEESHGPVGWWLGLTASVFLLGEIFVNLYTKKKGFVLHSEYTSL